jgi:polyribonucleotide nucleotidyltransferase
MRSSGPAQQQSGPQCTVDDAEAKRWWLKFVADDETVPSTVNQAFEEVYADVVRTRIINDGKRPDGRGLTEVRPIWCEVGYQPARARLRPVHPW